MSYYNPHENFINLVKEKGIENIEKRNKNIIGFFLDDFPSDFSFDYKRKNRSVYTESVNSLGPSILTGSGIIDFKQISDDYNYLKNADLFFATMFSGYSYESTHLNTLFEDFDRFRNSSKFKNSNKPYFEKCFFESILPYKTVGIDFYNNLKRDIIFEDTTFNYPLTEAALYIKDPNPRLSALGSYLIDNYFEGKLPLIDKVIVYRFDSYGINDENEFENTIKSLQKNDGNFLNIINDIGCPEIKNNRIFNGFGGIRISKSEDNSYLNFEDFKNRILTTVNFIHGISGKDPDFHISEDWTGYFLKNSDFFTTSFFRINDKSYYLIKVLRNDRYYILVNDDNESIIGYCFYDYSHPDLSAEECNQLPAIKMVREEEETGHFQLQI